MPNFMTSYLLTGMKVSIMNYGIKLLGPKSQRNANSKKNILIYADQGTSLFSVLGSFYRFNNIIKPDTYNMKFVTAAYLTEHDWHSSTALLIMPGGRARPFYQSLGSKFKTSFEYSKITSIEKIGKGNEKIKEFVLNKEGAFIGICAGAYYASTLTIFEKNNPLEVMDEGALNFYPGIAQGPVYNVGKFSYKSLGGLEAAKIALTHNTKKEPGYAYFNGGCFFKDKLSKNSDFKTLGVYGDKNLPAIIHNKNILLTGVHFEISHYFLLLYLCTNYNIYQKLKQHKKFQYYCLYTMLKAVHIETNNNDRVYVP